MNALNEKKEFQKLTDNAKAYYVSTEGQVNGETYFVPVEECQLVYMFNYGDYQFRYDKSGFYIYDEFDDESIYWSELEREHYMKSFHNHFIFEKILLEKVKKLRGE